MKLFTGFEAEYQRRHDAIWPELRSVLKAAGVKDYSIFLDVETGFLFAYLTIDEEDNLDKLSENEIVKKWWAYMKDIMDTNADHSPVSISLKEVFYLP